MFRRKLHFMTLIVGVVTSSTLAGAQGVPDVCSGQRSCFMAFDGRDRGFCQAYVERQSCFMAFNDPIDRGWCEHLRDGKSCLMALSGSAQADCNAGRIPREHRHWLRLCRGS